MIDQTRSRYGLEIAIAPGAQIPARYATTAETYERDFTVSTGSCRVCRTPRYRHRWVLLDGDKPVDCSEMRHFG